MTEDIKIVIGYIKDFLSKRSLILIVVGLFTLLGVFVAIFGKKEFKASTKFVTQVSDDQQLGSGLKNIAALVGLNFNNGGESKDLPVFLYPKIINSYPFQKEVLDTPIQVSSLDSSISLRKYLSDIRGIDAVEKLRKYTIGLPQLLFKKDKDFSSIRRVDSLKYIPLKEYELIQMMQEMVMFSVDEIDGSMSIDVAFEERVAAAQIAEKSMEILQKRVIEYRIKKAEEQFAFIEKQYEDKKEIYQSSQSKLAYHIDRNRFNVTQSSQLTKQRLETDFAVAYSVYSELETQKLRQQIKVQENTPSFIILQEPIVPVLPVNDSAPITILKFLIIGFIVSIFIYIMKITHKNLKTFWKSA